MSKLKGQFFSSRPLPASEFYHLLASLLLPKVKDNLV